MLKVNFLTDNFHQHIVVEIPELFELWANILSVTEVQLYKSVNNRLAILRSEIGVFDI